MPGAHAPSCSRRVLGFGSALGDTASLGVKLEQDSRVQGEKQGQVFTSKLPFYVYRFRCFDVILKS